MANLNGTVLMLANDADGNQILIERNMADLENDDSVHDMAQYVFQDGAGFALEDYEAIVENQGVGEEEDEEAAAGSHQEHGFEMEIGGNQTAEEEEEVEEVEEVQQVVDEDELLADREEEVEAQQVYEEELSSGAKS